LAFFVATIKVSVKAFEGLEQENAYISATRPSIKILSTFFTIQLLILGAATPKTSKKVGIYGQKWQKSIIAYFFFSFASETEEKMNETGNDKRLIS
jgi:hypothetical protein